MRVLSHFLRWRLGLALAETQTTPAERDCLARHAARCRTAAEIGVWHGVTTRRLREAMSAAGVLYAIDPYPAGRLGVSLQRIIARREVSRAGGATVEWVRMTGAAAGAWYAARGLPPVEFLFIDGDHTWEGIASDWEAWSGLVAPGGHVALHDSRVTPVRPIEAAGSVRFTNEVIRRDPRYRVMDEVDSVTVLERTA